MSYFILSPQNRFYTPLYAWALKLSFFYRIGITLLFLGIIGACWFYGIYHPNELVINQYQLDIVALQNKGVINAVLHKECAQEQKKIEDLENSLLSLPTTMLTEKIVVPSCLPFCLTDIVSYLNTAGLKLAVGSRGNLLDKGWYTKQVMHVNATGTMASIKKFFEQLYESKKMISSSAFEISHIDNDQFALVVDLTLFMRSCARANSSISPVLVTSSSSDLAKANI